MELPIPELGDNKADVDRLVRELTARFPATGIHVPYGMWNLISRTMRDSGFKVTAGLTLLGPGMELISIEADDTREKILGLAVDLGTTSVVAYLMDLRTGGIVEQVTVDNPQIQHGPDVLSRIQFAGEKGGLERLRDLIRECLNQTLARMCEKQGLRSDHVLAAAVAGNTTMTHLFLGLDPFYIRREPYIPLINSPGMITAKELNLKMNPNGYVYVFPNVGSYFGGDLVAGILSSGMHRKKEVSLLVDIGTNAEVVLGNRDWLLACAGAAGPALEGGVAKMGIKAGDGAIDHIKINPRTLKAEYSMVGRGKPLGICGSGLIDLTAELYLRGIMDMRGKFIPETGAPFTKTEDGLSYIVVPASQSRHGEDITISQVDIDILLRSKAAMYTILRTITNQVGLSFEDIAKFYVAGTFGTYIEPRKAVILGMVPDIPLEKYVSLGNSSGRGACELLLKETLRHEIKDICDKLTYIELNVNQLFMNLFSAALFIPHTERNLFPSVHTDLESLEEGSHIE